MPTYILFTGSHVAAVTYEYTATGGLATSGSGTTSFAVAPSFGNSSGVSSVNIFEYFRKVFIYAGSGRKYFNGAALSTHSRTFVFGGSGGLVLDGAAETKQSHTRAWRARGHGSLFGSAIVSKSHAYNAKLAPTVLGGYASVLYQPSDPDEWILFELDEIERELLGV